MKGPGMLRMLAASLLLPLNVGWAQDLHTLVQQQQRKLDQALERWSDLEDQVRAHETHRRQ